MDKKYLVQLEKDVIAITVKDVQDQLSVYVHDGLTEEGTEHEVSLAPVGSSGLYLLMIDNVPYELHIEPKKGNLEIIFGREKFLVDPIPWINEDSIVYIESDELSDSVLTAIMSGIVGEIFVNNGDSVKKGDILLTIESMKMNNEIIAPNSGNIEDLNLSVGEQVKEGDMLLCILNA